MNKLIDLLSSLNRKERYFLVGDALDNRQFKLGNDYRQRLEKATQLAIPADSWVAMDYHLDWIAAAVHLTSDGTCVTEKFRNPKEQPIVHGTQEDVDLIVGFGTESNTTLVIVEAKGDTPWSNSQMKSKAKRLGSIFGYRKSAKAGITVSLVLSSPKEPSAKLDTDLWPKWMVKNDGRPRWILMDMGKRRRLIRCDEKSNKSARGGFAIIR